MLRALLCTCLVLAVASAEESKQYQEAYLAGVEEAEADLAAGTARILSFGLGAGAGLDADTGLPLEAIAGCIVDDGILGRAAGYNEVIRARAEGGPIPGNLQAWQALIAEPATALDDGAGVPLVDGTVADPSGIWTLRREADLIDLIDLTAVDGEDETAKPVVLMRLATQPEANPVELQWGPPGSDLLVLALDQGDWRLVLVADLRRRLMVGRQVLPAGD